MSDASFDLFHLIPKCPVCGDRIELVYDRPTAKVCVCVNCHTGITVPARALSIADQQRDPTDASGGPSKMPVGRPYGSALRLGDVDPEASFRAAAASRARLHGQT